MQLGTDKPPIVAGTVTVTSTLVWVWVLTFSANGDSRHLLLAIGLILLSAVGITGLVVARGKWARRYLWIMLAAQGAVFVVVEPSIVALTASALAALALGVTSVDGWMRQLPRADAPPDESVLLPLGLLAIPVVIGLTRVPDGMDWTFAGLATVAAWSYGRAHIRTLWAIRVALLPVTLAIAGWEQDGAILILFGAALSAVAWRSGALRGVQPLEARRVTAQPVFAEMTPSGLMESIGRDEHGRKRS